MNQNAIVIPVRALGRIFTLLLVLIVVIFAVIVVRAQFFRAGAADLIDRSAYQAVFLTSGATYFGKLAPQGDDWYALTDVYYLQNTDQGTPQLIKRGNEAQGPREPMIIARSQIQFIENMRDDSDVGTLIKRFKSGQVPATTLAPATATPTPTPAASTPRPSATR